MVLSDTLSFWRAWLRAPRRVGAVAPSGPALARLMTRHVDHRHGPVIELGPGTGVFTRALLAAGLPPHRLALVEADPVFASALSRRHPGARVLCMDAAQLGDTQPLFDGARAGAVISGLPLLSMPPVVVARIVSGLFERQLHDDGVLHQFTYGVRCPLSRSLLDQLDLEATRVGSAMFNLPPATVYRIRRRQRTRVIA
jgi:phosphatidylethanolamine/phosphatidyl-N-methylethanolamine N-methyltransferase